MQRNRGNLPRIGNNPRINNLPTRRNLPMTYNLPMLPNSGRSSSVARSAVRKPQSSVVFRDKSVTTDDILGIHWAVIFVTLDHCTSSLWYLVMSELNHRWLYSLTFLDCDLSKEIFGFHRSLRRLRIGTLFPNLERCGLK